MCGLELLYRIAKKKHGLDWIGMEWNEKSKGKVPRSVSVQEVALKEGAYVPRAHLLQADKPVCRFVCIQESDKRRTIHCNAIQYNAIPVVLAKVPGVQRAQMAVPEKEATEPAAHSEQEVRWEGAELYWPRGH